MSREASPPPFMINRVLKPKAKPHKTTSQTSQSTQVSDPSPSAVPPTNPPTQPVGPATSAVAAIGNSSPVSTTGGATIVQTSPSAEVPAPDAEPSNDRPHDTSTPLPPPAQCPPSLDVTGADTGVMSSSNTKNSRKMVPSCTFTARNFCAKEWCQAHPGGTVAEFGAYWSSIKGTSEEGRFNQVARDRKAAAAAAPPSPSTHATTSTTGAAAAVVPMRPTTRRSKAGAVA